MTTHSIREVPLALPHQALLSADWGDRFAVTTGRSFTDAEMVARTMLEAIPGWASGLMKLRDHMVSPLGLKTGEQMIASPNHTCIGFFPIVSNTPNQIVLGENDSHLDFRVVVDIEQTRDGQQRIALSTLVKRNNAMGRAYLAAIMPFHKLIVKAMLRTVS